MSWFRWFGREPEAEGEAELAAVRETFSTFSGLLDGNKHVLEVIADLEEKSQGEHLFDINYIRASRARLREAVADVVEKMVALGGGGYAVLRARHAAIEEEIDGILEARRKVPEDAYTIPLDELDRSRADSVGGKSAQLGELASRLGLPVPQGFAVSAWAYERFVDANDLRARVAARVRALDIRHFEDLVRASCAIRKMVMDSEVPSDLARSLIAAAAEIEARSGASRFALRSSALGEDSLLSFAGQYATILCVRRGELLDRYREVLAGKFSPHAIYYLLSHDLREIDVPMGVACLAMVDAVAGGVVYSRDPLHAEKTDVLVHSVFGLGQYLVDGTLTPDVFRVRREDGKVAASTTARKPVRLALGPDGAVEEQALSEAEQVRPSLADEHAAILARHATRLEDHYGTPQDVEWALDRDGRILLLQTRPLRVLHGGAGAALDVSRLPVLRTGGAAVCWGAGSGPVCQVGGAGDLDRVEAGAVVVSARPFPGLVTVMGKASAIVTEVGGAASHMATLAREYCVPTLAGIEGATEIPEGTRVTVDATRRVVYAGEHPELAEARRPERDLFEGTAIFGLLQKVLEKIVPLNLVHAGAPGFRPEACRTLHDITRFAHQKAMEEMFCEATRAARHHGLGVVLQTAIPLEVRVIDMDEPTGARDRRGRVPLDELRSTPFKAFWRGVEEEGWPAQALDIRGFVSVVTTQMGTGRREDFAEASFALTNSQYMLLSLHLGYHFTTIESLCTPEPSKNYVRMQFKGGGASTDRRIRRTGLMAGLLSKMGFEHACRGDFLDTHIAYLDEPATTETLRLLGRLTMLTKQLDMALSNDAVARWYAQEFARKLGLDAGEAPS